MKLFYWGDRPELPTNFGDQLNPWLWPRVLPELFGPTATGPSNSEECRPALFLGIGTVLNSAIPPDAAEYVVLGAGAGYGVLPTIDERWRIYAVRGPLTARELGLDDSVAVVDPAVLVPSVLEQGPEPVRTGPAFMPHWSSNNAGWHDVCRDAGLTLIDPLASVDAIIAAIRSATVLIAEAMHGAIVADAFRVPWVAVHTLSEDHLPFKWRDWCASVALPHVSHAPPRPQDGHPIGIIARELDTLATDGPRHCLSSSAVLDAKVTELGRRIEQLRVERQDP